MTSPVFTIKEIPSVVLLEAYKPEEIMGYCALCRNHDSVWSCPPHRFNPFEFISRFKYAYVVNGSVSMEGFEDQADALIHYYEMRRQINQALLGFEATVPGSVSLYAGHCDACKSCARTTEQECIHSDLCRYSLESLGLDVARIIETHFGEILEWIAGEIPEKLLVVPALLSPVRIDIPPFIQALEKCRAGVSPA